MKLKTFTITIVILAAIALALALGLALGRKQGGAEIEQKLSPLVDLAFPKPPDEIKNFSGTITKIYGAIINLEIVDPDDYLPRTDGTPHIKEIRLASISSATEIMLVDYTKPDNRGNPTITPLELSDLKVGDTITVRSDQNIRDAEKFDVTRVELVRY